MAGKDFDGYYLNSGETSILNMDSERNCRDIFLKNEFLINPGLFALENRAVSISLLQHPKVVSLSTRLQ